MKIKRITIDSFGGIRNWRSPDLEENLVVVYGPNESGKSTITEFIRGTLFPPKTVKYPVASKTDSGTVEVVMDSGDERILVREQKKVTEGSGKKTVYEEFPSLDAETYRSLYGLDLERLTDKKVVSSNDFRKKFLTVPGGEKVPEVSESIEKKLDSLMTKEKLTDNREVGRIVKDIKNIDQRIVDIHEEMDKYDKLSVEKEDLMKRIAEKRKAQQLMLDVHAKKQILKSQSANLERLNELKLTRNDYEKYRDIPLESKNQYEILRSRVDELAAQAEDAAEIPVNYSEVLTHRDEIEEAWRGRDDYISDMKAVKRIEETIMDYENDIANMERITGWNVTRAKLVKTGQEVSERAEQEMRRQNNKGILFFGIVLTILGMAAAIAGAVALKDYLYVLIGGCAAAVLGIIVIILSIKHANKPSKQWRNWITLQGYPISTTPEKLYKLSMDLERMVNLSREMDRKIAEKNEIDQNISDYVNSVFPLFNDLNMTMTNLESDVAVLHDMLVEANNSVTTGDDTSVELRDKRIQLSKFLKRYGDENAFLEAYAGREELERLDSEIRTLTQSIEASTQMSINDLNTFFDDEDGGAQKDDFDTGDMDRRVGEIETEMKAIMEDGEIDSLMQRRANSENALMDKLREWAVYSIANSLMLDACDHFYTDLQPNVIKYANRYLSLMTEGRYQLDNDPRAEEITVKDNYMKKNANKWSSGLGDQIYLSLKMAMAGQIGAEKMPLILDDVLIRFDDDRKLGACRAIYEFSRDNQVIIFTCENNLRNLFNICGRHMEIRLS